MGAKAKIQKFGSFLSSMVMPNIGAFIGWGVLAALFIDTGWCPNKYLNQLVSPTLTYLMPLLISYTGGFNIYGKRGGVAGAIATMGVIVGADITMLAGGMIMGPLGAVVIKHVDKLFEGKVKPGFEMLVDNFSMGFVGALMMVFGYVIVEPVFSVILAVLSTGVQFLVDANLLPFTSIFVQPAQVLFLNNAINHGIMIPIGIEQAAKTGKSILFLVEANGGVWVGLLLAFSIWGKGMAKKSAPGAALIMAFGGIGEVAFPYALIRPITILGPICGNIVALFILQIFHGGTVAAVSPGSFLALLAMTPKGGFFTNILAYVAGMGVSFLVAGFFLMRDKSVDEDELALELANDAQVSSDSAPVIETESFGKRTINKVLFACDAGMGSSVMASSILKTQLNKVGLSVDVGHASLNEIPEDSDVIVTSEILYDRAKSSAPAGVPIIPVKNLIDGNELAEVAKKIKAMAE